MLKGIRRVVVLASFLLLAVTGFAAEAPLIRIVPLHGHRKSVSQPNTPLARPPQSIEAIAAALRDRLASSPHRTSRVLALGTLQSKIGNELGRDRVIERGLREGRGTPLEILGESPSRTASLSSAPVDSLEAAKQFLNANRGTLHIADPERELVLDRDQVDELGRRHFRFSQQLDGVRVWPSDLNVHLNASGGVERIDGSYAPTPRLLVKDPLVDGSRATRLALRAVHAGPAATITAPELIVYTPLHRRPRLAWKMDVSATLLSRWTVIIDATNGVMLDALSRNMTENAVGSGIDLSGVRRPLNLWHDSAGYSMIDTTKPMYNTSSRPPNVNDTRGAIIIYDAANQPPTSTPDSIGPLQVSASTNPTFWSIPATVSAAYWLSFTYDYYLSVFNRNSIDGKAGTISGMTRFGSNYQNAMWLDGSSLMVFGDGDAYAASVDVIGHEMTHGVTSKSAGLIYKDQSGALNEAMSDIFGKMIDSRATGATDWLIGSHLSHPIRSMSDPGRFGDPAKMSDYVNTTSDHGGVHTNSGIISKAFYNLAEGLDGGIGKQDAQRIFYRALTEHLVKSSQFIDARVSTIASAEELFGIGSKQALATARAFDAVEVFDATAVPAPKTIPAIEGQDATLFIYYNATTKSYFLARKEIGSDGADGATLSRFDVSASRPSISGDGTVAAFIDSVNDVCLISTDGSQQEKCLDLPKSGIRVSSVAMSPDAARFGFVLLDSQGKPDNQIDLIDLTSKTVRPITLNAPATDAGNFSSILFADAMALTADGNFVVFDALNALILSDGSLVGAWSIYALDFDSGDVFDVVPPIPDIDIESPSLGKTSDDLITFEAVDSATGKSTVLAGNLESGDTAIIGSVQGVPAAPSFMGDDLGIVYAAPSSSLTGASLIVQRLEADHVTPRGSASVWLNDGAYAAMYRRGTYAGPTTTPGSLGFAGSTFRGNAGSEATITVARRSGNKGSVSIVYSITGGSASAGRDYSPVSGSLAWSDGDTTGKTFTVQLLPGAVGNSTVVFALSSPTGGASVDVGNTTLFIAAGFVPPPQSPAKRRAARH